MAITTIYRGIEYRSRLEARWASFFTSLGWHHTYEPFDGDGYIPDFLVHGDNPILVEVKPAVGLKDYQAATAKAENGLRSLWTNDILILGADPFPHLKNAWAGHYPPAGLLGEYHPDEEFMGPAGWWWDTANWFRCGKCGQPAVFHEAMTWSARPCGHYEGDHFLGAIDRGWLERMWAAACNDVKWRGQAA